MAANKGIKQYWHNLPGSIKALHVFAVLVLGAVFMVLFVAPAFIFLATLLALL